MPPKRVWKKMLKQNRKSNKCWADGARDSILRPHIDAYSDALSRGARAERTYFTRVCVEYHARIDWRLKDHEEPPLPLAPYDPNAEVEPEEELTTEEEDERHERVRELNKRIHTWLKYRARRLNNSLLSHATDSNGPFVPLVAKLGGLKSPGKARQAFQQFQHEEIVTLRETIKKAWRDKCKADDVDPEEKGPSTAFRTEVARQTFKALPQAEQNKYAATAKKEAAERKAAYVKALKDGPSKAPEDRQKCIDNLGPFLGAIMRGIADYTGWQVLVVVGGPMPKWNGEIGTVHLSVGKNLDTVPVSFPAWKKDDFAANVTGFFKKYLGTAYSLEQCAEMALAVTEAPPLTTSLSAAEYKIAAGGDNEGNWEDEQDEDGDDEDDEDDEESSDEEEEAQPSRKKRKAGSTEEDLPKKKKQKPAAASTVLTSSSLANGTSGDGDQVNLTKLTDAELKTLQAPAGLGIQEKFEWSKRRNAELMRRMGLKHAGSEMAELEQRQPKPRPVPRPLTKSSETKAAPRRSGRLDTVVEKPSGTQDEDVLMLDAGGGAASPPPLNETPAPPPAPNETPAPPPPRLDIPLPRVETPPPPPNETPAPPPPRLDIPLPRVETAPPPPNETPACPNDAPIWIGKILPEISAVLLGPTYHEILQAWVDLEMAYVSSEYEATYARVETKDRPKEVGDWIQNARRVPVKISKLAVFEAKWSAWWAKMQPSWRQEHSLPGGDETDRDWGILAAPGVNGMLSVVATLYWWGCTEKAESSVADWDAATQDVLLVLGGLKASLGV
ncbi:hypothetical protein FB45DRAFT_800748 [Roridomyces roridus]|uniref:Uncharacterized protein n=1 Tax=Roridomyces roridus TaxID=1738132 RepID=A0AAD7BDI8_9AGAR|nr:hypothetical protein FB45DRAFT_800748 [Roridomyces roridus]